MMPSAELSSQVSLSQDNNHNHSVLEYERVGAFILGVSGFIYTPIVLTLLILLSCVYRAYKTTLQRLTLYHVLIVLFCECTFAMRIEINFEAPRWICTSVSYFFLYFHFSWYIYTTAVTNFSFIVTLHLLKTGHLKIWKGSKLAECICLVMAIALPMAYISAPIHDQSYLNLSCDNRESVRWYKDSVILNILTLVMCIEVVTVSAVFSGLFCYLRWRLKNRKLSTLLKHLLYLTGINTVIMIFTMMAAVYFIYRYNRPPSETLSVVAFSIICAREPFLFFVSTTFQSFLSIRRQNHSIRSCICCKKDHERLHMDVTNKHDQTNPTSIPINQPSHTYFSVPYTGAFTQVSLGEHNAENNEGTPLIMHI